MSELLKATGDYNVRFNFTFSVQMVQTNFDVVVVKVSGSKTSKKFRFQWSMAYQGQGKNNRFVPDKNIVKVN